MNAAAPPRANIGRIQHHTRRQLPLKATWCRNGGIKSVGMAVCRMMVSPHPIKHVMPLSIIKANIGQ